MKYPLVSVGIPVFNGEQWIRRALDSLLKQDYPNIEILVSDNASDDMTVNEVNEYAAVNKNIRILKNDVNIGIFNNFKNVLSKSSGEYFMWAAVDDCWETTFISSLVNKLVGDESFAVAQSATQTVSETDLEKIGYIRFTGSNNPENCSMLQLTKKIVSPLKYNLYIYGIFRRKLLIEAFAYMPSIPSSDRWFLLQFPLAGYRFAYVDEPLYIRTIANDPLYDRYPYEPLAKKIKVKHTKTTWFQFEPVWVVRDMLYKSSLVKRKSLFNISVVLSQLARRRLKVGIKLMIRTIVVVLLPNKYLQIIKSKLKNNNAKIVYGRKKWE